MNPAYPQPPYQMSRALNEGPYRSIGPLHPNPNFQLHHPGHLPSSHPSTITPRQFPDPSANPYGASRMPVPEGMGGERSLVPGQPPHPRELLSTSREENGRRYELRVIQQPMRARMCGFGDKDRRPITPPPCVQLIITDVNTGAVINPSEVEHSLMILMVDLWDAAGANEVNLVRNDSGSSPIMPSTISSSHQQMSYATGPNEQMSGGNHYGVSSQQGQNFNPYPGQPQVNPYPGTQNQQYGQAPQPYGQQQQYPQYPPQHQQPNPGYVNGAGSYPQNGYGPPPPPSPYYSTGAQSQGMAAHDDYGPPSQQFQARQYQPEPLQQRNTATNPESKGGMYTRNLIGSLAASASKLIDTNEKLGIWFVLQDLSVRTEGDFRLRFSYCNVALPSMHGRAPAPKSGGSNNNMGPMSPLNTGKAAVLATVFSEPFQVFSAKRFPGVVESTPLSKIFAAQGIKIPIRKDTNGRAADKHQEEEEDDD